MATPDGTTPSAAPGEDGARWGYPSPGVELPQGPAPDATALRRLVLACVVLHDIDAVPGPDGVVVDGAHRPLTLTWRDVADAAVRTSRDDIASGPGGVLRLLLAARMCASRSGQELTEAVRPVALPPGHLLHPGRDWVHARIRGGALELGPGFVGVGADPDAVELLAPAVLGHAGHDTRAWWPPASDYLERMGTVAATRLTGPPSVAGRLIGPASPTGSRVLRPIGDCDVLTLLCSVAFRAALAGLDGTGMAAVAAPMRRRGWLDLRRIDPQFVLAAAAATSDAERGVRRPLLVTADEVVLAPEHAAGLADALADPLPDNRTADPRWTC